MGVSHLFEEDRRVRDYSDVKHVKSTCKTTTVDDYDSNAQYDKQRLSEKAHENYIKAMEATKVCYDKFHRIIKVGMRVAVCDAEFIVQDIVFLGEAQIPWLKLSGEKNLVIPHYVTIIAGGVR